MKNLAVRLLGTPSWSRWAIFDESRAVWFAGADRWTPVASNAQLYSRMLDLARDYQQIEFQLLKGTKVQEWEAVIKVQVWSNNSNYSLDQLRAFLLSTVAVSINYNTMAGEGPIEGSVVTGEIEWSRLCRKP